jgi:protein SCO1
MLLPRARHGTLRRPTCGALALAWLCLLPAAGCSLEGADGVRRFRLTGVIVDHDASPSRIIVAHDPVDGFMPAMTMPFEIRGGVPEAREGDRIAATLIVVGSGSWLEDVTVTAGDGAATPRDAAGSRAIPGAVVPDLVLLDQDNRRTTVRDAAAGRVTVVTFIYSRCPLPEVCPLVIRNLEAVRRLAAGHGVDSRLALFAVTLDPAFDTPAVLRAYGETVLAGSDRFDGWTLATGTPAQVEAAAAFFGVGYRAGQGFVTHTLSTTVVGHDGRVMRTFASNSWRPQDVFEVVRQGIARAPVQ